MSHAISSRDSAITVYGRTWSRGEYARFLILDAGLSTRDAARLSELPLQAVRMAASRCAPEYCLQPVRPGARPFIARDVLEYRRQSRAASVLRSRARRLLAEADRIRSDRHAS